ncbi:hypothetical protein GCM10008090_16440 [Arenicella chitinivorans]|uniref:histidine kinase n=1 Tax=Arenicella chitinivorans TaxID=1329800 RepID=A0A918VM95_9GAMM|nr:HAMP domain-containing sensor histidine kinase [Arenicella chitinivorans]GHA07318.1 hypothetical protein GCM10008090_16440 [Arenicella chitinivorans]
MRTRNLSATIRQQLALAYLVISVPAFAFTILSLRALDHRIEQAQLSPIDGDQFALATTPRSAWLMSLGTWIRVNKLPLSISPRLDEANDNNTRVAYALSDVRTAVLYLRTCILFVGAFVIILLSQRLSRPLRDLNRAIELLSHDRLDQQVRISGARNFQEMGEGLEKLRVQLLTSEAQKTQFLQHISHEIKTPLTSIKEGSALLQDELLGPINDEQRSVTDILVKSSQELQLAIENLLDYNSAISAANPSDRSSVFLDTLVRTALARHQVSITQRNLTINSALEAIKSTVNKSQITSVFSNLISNAVKHSPEGGHLQLSLNLNDEGKAEFTIADQGHGISSHERARIFDAFFVGKQQTPSTLKGTGLGLSLVKRYVEAHDGRVECLNPRKGAAFRVVLNADSNSNSSGE